MTRLILVALMALLAPVAHAQDQDTPARAAFLIDVMSGAVLLEKEADQPLPPASMSKLMTLYMAFEALDRGVVGMEDTFRTSARASAMGGSKMFLRQGEVVSVRDMLRGVIVQSGNDAAVALAEALGGTEEAFAERMTERAREIGLTNSVFANSTGWPAENHHMSVRDLAILSMKLVTEFSQYYPMFAEEELTWDGVKQANRNPLLGLGIGADGLKTGHTEEAGYGLAASAVRDGRRVVLVLAGLDSSADRRREAERLINWAFRAFETRKLYSQGERLIDAPVWIGAERSVPLVPERDIVVTAPIGKLAETRLRVVVDGPVPAPVAEGQPIAVLEVAVPDLSAVRVPLVAARAVERGGILARIRAAGQSLIIRLSPG